MNILKLFGPIFSPSVIFLRRVPLLKLSKSKNVHLYSGIIFILRQKSCMASVVPLSGLLKIIANQSDEDFLNFLFFLCSIYATAVSETIAPAQMLPSCVTCLLEEKNFSPFF